MPKPKKDWTALNIRMNSGIYDALAQYADDKGQNKTVAVERILKEYLEKEGYKIEKKSSNQRTSFMLGKFMISIKDMESYLCYNAIIERKVVKEEFFDADLSMYEDQVAYIRDRLLWSVFATFSRATATKSRAKAAISIKNAYLLHSLS